MYQLRLGIQVQRQFRRYRSAVYSWLLTAGLWDDLGFWRDTAYWNDGE